MLQLDWESEGIVEALGAMLGQDDRQVKGDLERFKELIEKQGRRPALGAAKSSSRPKTTLHARAR